MNQAQHTLFPSIFQYCQFKLPECQIWLTALALSLWFFNGIDASTLFLVNLKDSGHGLVFFISTYLLSNALAVLPMLRRRYLHICILSLLISLLIGAAIELVQPYVGRQASWRDFWYDGIGSVAACLFFWARTGLNKQSVGLYLLASTLLLSIASQPTYYGWIEAQQRQQVPKLLNFEQGWQLNFIDAIFGGRISIEQAPKPWLENNSKVLRLTMKEGRYPGFNFRHPPSDWQAYSRLEFDIYSPAQEAFELGFRIHDKQHYQSPNTPYHDRFNRRLTIAPGLNKVSIELTEVAKAPRERAMNMGAIDDVILYTVSPKQARTIYLDNMRLR